MTKHTPEPDDATCGECCMEPPVPIIYSSIPERQRRIKLCPPHRQAKALLTALIAARDARLATGRQSTCDKQAHGDSHIECGECFICLERAAIDAATKEESNE